MYKSKYLKYKEKYLKLRSQIGGTENKDEHTNSESHGSKTESKPIDYMLFDSEVYPDLILSSGYDQYENWTIEDLLEKKTRPYQLYISGISKNTSVYELSKLYVDTVKKISILLHKLSHYTNGNNEISEKIQTLKGDKIKYLGFKNDKYVFKVGEYIEYNVGVSMFGDGDGDDDYYNDDYKSNRKKSNNYYPNTHIPNWNNFDSYYVITKINGIQIDNAYNVILHENNTSPYDSINPKYTGIENNSGYRGRILIYVERNKETGIAEYIGSVRYAITQPMELSEIPGRYKLFFISIYKNHLYRQQFLPQNKKFSDVMLEKLKEIALKHDCSCMYTAFPFDKMRELLIRNGFVEHSPIVYKMLVDIDFDELSEISNKYLDPEFEWTNPKVLEEIIRNKEYEKWKFNDLILDAAHENIPSSNIFWDKIYGYYDEELEKFSEKYLDPNFEWTNPKILQKIIENKEYEKWNRNVWEKVLQIYDEILIILWINIDKNLISHKITPKIRERILDKIQHSKEQFGENPIFTVDEIIEQKNSMNYKDSDNYEDSDDYELIKNNNLHIPYDYKPNDIYEFNWNDLQKLKEIIKKKYYIDWNMYYNQKKRLDNGLDIKSNIFLDMIDTRLLSTKPDIIDLINNRIKKSENSKISKNGMKKYVPHSKKYVPGL